MSDTYIDYASPEVMAQTLMDTMRHIGMHVRLNHQGGLNIGPSNMVWESDKEIIRELKPYMIDILKREESANQNDHFQHFA